MNSTEIESNSDLNIKKKLIKLALPATVENILETSVGFIDSLMISQIGLFAVAGVGIANAVLNVYIAVFIALGIGTSSLISRYIGADNSEKAKLIAKQSLLLAIVSGLCLGLVSLLIGPQLLKLMGATEQTFNYSLQFFCIVGGGSVTIATMIILGSILRALGDTKSPMKIGLITNILNIILDYILIFGLGPLPALGVAGTAIGTLVARLLGTILLYRKVQSTILSFSFRSIFQRSNYQELLNLSFPAALERFVMRLGQVLYFGLIVAIGAKTYSAHSIAGSIESFVYMPAYGLATAAATLAGNSIGKKDYVETKRVAFYAVKYGVIVLSILGIGLFFGTPYIAPWFTTDAEAIKQIVIALRIDSFNQPGLAISLILAGVLQGMGDTKTPLYSTAFGMWVTRILGVILLGNILDLGIAGVWLAIGMDLYIRSLFLIYRFRRNIQILNNNNETPS
ncbi:MATE family efflux transporter [Listeria monocytogenes]|uniref:MATE family efflux transporter n=1 Tax=Bacilli TaxID=91061 RepID=UPI0007E45A8D|nr:MULTISPECIES: MATE family efflux transporter [Bacilli]EAC5283575.1 MATE family efflux transporter [Listeria monocytogenes]EAC8925033.1 MATE family efflux transporter [Listeria monocytogenes]EAE7666829.1 MATE family efflux transporter [Listeria monocytogenes]EAE7681543.1 MATE family efflux transporter [Listeria monocytogenes]EAE8239433.1 MATE family efflux transporter [Listeria monocytogenes]